MYQTTGLLLSLCFLIQIGLGQPSSETRTTVGKNSVSGNILGTASYFGISYERLILQRYSLEVGIGIIGYGAGATVYPLKRVQIGKLAPYTGIKYTNHAIVDGENKAATYVPIGLTFFSRYWINLGFDIGPAIFQHKSPGYMPTPEELARYPYTDFGIWGNAKVGIRF